MKFESIWLKDYDYKNLQVLNKNIEVDVLIIGAGLTGLNTAYFLRESSLKICIVDQNKVGRGVSAKTTGKINYLQETVYSDLKKKYSLEVAKKYYETQKMAVKKYKEIIQKEQINCDLKKVKSYVLTNRDKEIIKLKREKDILNDFGEKVEDVTKIMNNVNCKYGIGVNDTYVFHPVKYMIKMRDICLNFGINIYEDTGIRKICKKGNYYICNTDKYQIKCNKIILACHYSFF